MPSDESPFSFQVLLGDITGSVDLDPYLQERGLILVHRSVFEALPWSLTELLAAGVAAAGVATDAEGMEVFLDELDAQLAERATTAPDEFAAEGLSFLGGIRDGLRDARDAAQM